MGLSESEKRVLEELERGLYAEDASIYVGRYFPLGALRV